MMWESGSQPSGVAEVGGGCSGEHSVARCHPFRQPSLRGHGAAGLGRGAHPVGWLSGGSVQLSHSPSQDAQLSAQGPSGQRHPEGHQHG